MTEITTEDLLALTKSADLLRATAEKALRVEALEREFAETKERNRGLWERAGAAENHVNRLTHEKLDLQGDLRRCSAERDAWESTAAQNQRNADYRRDQLLEIAKVLGDEVFTDAAGGLHDEPLLGKVPEVVVATIERLRRENETLARQVPPTPPLSAFDTPIGAAALAPDQPTLFTKSLGQQWVRVTSERDTPNGTTSLGFKTRSGWVVLCEVRQNVATGALTHHPLSFEDLTEFCG